MVRQEQPDIGAEGQLGTAEQTQKGLASPHPGQAPAKKRRSTVPRKRAAAAVSALAAKFRALTVRRGRKGKHRKVGRPPGRSRKPTKKQLLKMARQKAAARAMAGRQAKRLLKKQEAAAADE
jgi:hypothetical protein